MKTQQKWKIGDCLYLLPEIPDKSVNLLLTDPPYGITKNSWDIVPTKKYFDEMFRISKNQVIFGGNFFDLPKKSGWLIWYKRPFLNNSNEAELIWTSFNMKNVVLDYTYAGNCEGFCITNIRPNYKKKPVKFTSEKPLKVIEWILENYSKIGELICDPYLGSGTTLEACINLNRNCIGFEIDPQWEPIYRKRLKLDNAKLDAFNTSACPK